MQRLCSDDFTEIPSARASERLSGVIWGLAGLRWSSSVCQPSCACACRVRCFALGVRSDEFKYLGIVQHEVSHWQAALPLQRVKGRQSLGGMHCNLTSLQAGRDVALAFHMYDVCTDVCTILTYGSAVWATKFHAVEPNWVAHNDLEACHQQFMRRWCRLRANTPVWAIYAALGRLPLH